MPRRSGLASGLLLGSALDALLADPRRGHPVAAFGTAAARAEGRLWRASRLAARCSPWRARAPRWPLAGPRSGWPGGARCPARRLPPQRPGRCSAAPAWPPRRRGLPRAGAGDLDDARHRLPALCGRDPAGLPAAELARAAVESVAENTCDAVVAPLLWGAVAGVAACSATGR